MKGICHIWSRGRRFSPSLPAVGCRYLKIVASNESGCIKNGPTNHYSDRGHYYCVYKIDLEVVWKYFPVLVFFQGDAASHDSCKLYVVHNTRTGISCEV